MSVTYEMFRKVWPQANRKEGTQEALMKIGPWLNTLAHDGWRVVPGTFEFGFWGSNELHATALMEREELLGKIPGPAVYDEADHYGRQPGEPDL